MQTMRTKLGEGGRVAIPASFRQNLHLLPGDDIVLHIKENIIYITTPARSSFNKTTRKGKKLYRFYRKENFSCRGTNTFKTHRS